LRSPGREFLIALVLYARSADSDQKEQAGSEPEAASAARQPAAAAKSRAAGAPGAGAVTVASMLPGPAQDPSNRRIPSASPPTRKMQDSSGPVLSSDVRSIRNVLWSSAKCATDDVKKLDLYAATLEIDSFLDDSQHREIAKCVADGWERIRGGDQRTIDEAKLGLVYRFGDAARTVADRPDRGLSELDPEIEQRLRRVKGNDLPLCFTRNRDPLDPRATVGGLFKAPGRNCIDGCGYRLCPYPAYGGQPYRSELGEAFCRGQQTLLSRGLSAPWQTVPRANLKRFWAQMADRARGVNTDHDLD